MIHIHNKFCTDNNVVKFSILHDKSSDNVLA